MSNPCCGRSATVLPVDDNDEYAGDIGSPTPTQWRCCGCGHLESPEALRARAPYIFGEVV